VLVQKPFRYTVGNALIAQHADKPIEYYRRVVSLDSLEQTILPKSSTQVFNEGEAASELTGSLYYNYGVIEGKAGRKDRLCR
jgi:hypothetical protein